MADHLAIVKERERAFRVTLSELHEDEARHANLSRFADALLQTIEEVEHLRSITKAVPASYGELSDLPPELMDELAGVRSDDLEDQIFTIVKASEDGADLDTILIELYRRFKIIQKRRFIQNKAYRMAQKSMIFAVERRKGLYAASESEARRIAGNNQDGEEPGSSEDEDAETLENLGLSSDELDESMPF